MNSERDNYEQILYDVLASFVDTDQYGAPLVFRNNAPTLEEIQTLGDKVYCVYTVFEGAFGEQTAQPIKLYCYGNRQRLFNAKELITATLRNNAVVVNGQGIKVKFTGGNPLCQDAPETNDNIKGYYVNVVATIYKV